MNLIYCYDAYCGWCFGFSKIIEQYEAAYQHQFLFSVLSGGMVLPEQPTPIAQTASFVLEHYPRVEELSGAIFGEEYLWHLKNAEESDWFPDSTMPAIAMCILREQEPDKAVAFARDLQHALFVEGRDLTDPEAYRHLLPKYGLNEHSFYQKLKEEEYRYAAGQDFEMVKNLQVKGFPSIFIQATETKYYLVANGYTDFETLDYRTKSILSEINN